MEGETGAGRCGLGKVEGERGEVNGKGGEEGKGGR